MIQKLRIIDEDSMITKNMFGTTDLLGKALQASWLRNEAINHNIANVDTPGYKRKDVFFEKFFTQAMGKESRHLVDQAVRITPQIIEDKVNLSYRLDDNNVDSDTEMSYLAANQIRYNAITNHVNYNFSRIKAVLNSR